MAEAATKLPVKTEEKASTLGPALQAWWPSESLRREVDRLFDDFGRGFWSLPFRRSTFAVEPFWRREWAWGAEPAVDIAESDKAYEITAELPGMDEKTIELKLANGGLTIKGEKQKKRRRATISMSATSAPSSATSACQKASIPTRSRRASRTACSP